MSAAPILSVIVAPSTPEAQAAPVFASLAAQRSIALEVIALAKAGSTVAVPAGMTTISVDSGEGLFDALNRGIAAARGEWLMFLDPRDRLVGDMVLSESLNWMKKTDCGVVAGEAATNDGHLHKLPSPAQPIARDFVPRAASFYRRGLFDENGGFDPAFPVMARYELNVRLWKNRIRFKPIPLRIAATEADAVFDWAAAREEIRVRHRYYPAWRCWRWDGSSLLRAATARQPRHRSSS